MSKVGGPSDPSFNKLQDLGAGGPEGEKAADSPGEQTAADAVELVSAQAYDKLSAHLGGLGPLGPSLPWDCTGQKFACGEYQCTGKHGCANTFECNTKFTGLTPGGLGGLGGLGGVGGF